MQKVLNVKVKKEGIKKIDSTEFRQDFETRIPWFSLVFSLKCINFSLIFHETAYDFPGIENWQKLLTIEVEPILVLPLRWE